jgi:hypothetical protein
MMKAPRPSFFSKRKSPSAAIADRHSVTSMSDEPYKSLNIAKDLANCVSRIADWRLLIAYRSCS